MSEEDVVVQAALALEGWCSKHWDRNGCEECPFWCEKTRTKCIISPNRDPFEWGIEKYLQAREEKK